MQSVSFFHLLSWIKSAYLDLQILNSDLKALYEFPHNINIQYFILPLIINISNKWPNLIPKSPLKSVWKQHFETSLPVSRCDRRASSDHSNWSIVALTAWMRSFCDGPKWTANFLDCPRFESTSDALGIIHILRKQL